MPGVLIIEAMAQVGGMLLMGAVPDPREQGRVLHVAQQREVAPAGEAGRSDALRARAAAGARHDVQDVGRREGRRTGRLRGRDGRGGARQMSARIHPTRDRPSETPRSATTSRSARSRSSARTASIGDGCVIAARAIARAQRDRSASDVKVGVGHGARRRSAGSQVQGRADDASRSATARRSANTRTINRGTTQSFKTTVGKNCFLMSYVHLAHDCHIGDGVIISNGTQLAGHVTIDEKAILSRPRRACTSSRRSAGTASSAAARAWRRTFRRT